MEPILIMQHKFCVEIREKLFEMHMPPEYNVYEAYEAAMLMAQVYSNSIADNRAKLEKVNVREESIKEIPKVEAPVVKVEAPVVKVEASDEKVDAKEEKIVALEEKG